MKTMTRQGNVLRFEKQSLLSGDDLFLQKYIENPSPEDIPHVLHILITHYLQGRGYDNCEQQSQYTSGTDRVS